MAELLFLFFSALGVVWALRGVYGLSLSFASERWPTTSGRVVSSEIERSSGYNDRDNYRAAIRYTYEVGGSEYSSTRRCYGDELSVSWSGPSKGAVERYPPGTAVTVHYDPSGPSEAVLEPGVRWEVLGNIAGGLLFVAIGVAGLVIGWGS